MFGRAVAGFARTTANATAVVYSVGPSMGSEAGTKVSTRQFLRETDVAGLGIVAHKERVDGRVCSGSRGCVSRDKESVSPRAVVSSGWQGEGEARRGGRGTATAEDGHTARRQVLLCGPVEDCQEVRRGGGSARRCNLDVRRRRAADTEPVLYSVRAQVISTVHTWSQCAPPACFAGAGWGLSVLQTTLQGSLHRANIHPRPQISALPPPSSLPLLVARSLRCLSRRAEDVWVVDSSPVGAAGEPAPEATAHRETGRPCLISFREGATLPRAPTWHPSADCRDGCLPSATDAPPPSIC
ncbi:hypothetical protein P171DRAFT_449594 [Karstenula rhodostoma CBS 690.94]|uniref:Uncharacterized protein n=1 Tax=Karstenula rhodostoma CBS 690.94 TaxID=1392251 RepID=A0A9P4P5T4_9PLEO|nr:hypothetical protein P171DRAFT_449594 [Karstenula rhodostoma CBS 690.94]